MTKKEMESLGYMRLNEMYAVIKRDIIQCIENDILDKKCVDDYIEEMRSIRQFIWDYRQYGKFQ